MGKNKRKQFQKRNSLQNKESQPQESHVPSARSLENNVQESKGQEPKVLQQNESKGITVNDFILCYNFEDSDFYHDELHNGVENVIKALRAEISRLTTTCKDQEKLLQIYDDKEATLKEDIVRLKIKLAQLEKVEEGMRK